MASRASAGASCSKVYALLRDAAAKGEPCPSNTRIVEHVGYRSESSAIRALTNLCDAGLIRRVSPNQHRVIEIVSTGERTAERVVKEEPVVLPERTVREIIAVVARVAGMTPEDITGRCRTKLYTRPRFLVCHFAHAEGWTYAAIGRVLGGRDHSSIVNACDQVEPWLRADPLFARLYRRAEEALAAPRPDHPAFSAVPCGQASAAAVAA